MHRNFLTSTSWRYDDSGGKSTDECAHALKPRRQRAVFASCASAHDLRILDMEREKLDGSSPRGVIDACLRNLESEENSPENTTTEPETLCSNTKVHGHWTKFFKLWKRKSIKRFASFPPHTVPKTSKKKTKSPKEDIPTELSNLYNTRSSLVLYTLPELQAATNNFSHENLIGRGGYAKVYKGCLPNGQLVAVKRLTKGTADEKIASFLCEVGIVAHVNHPNIAKLIGCGVEGGMHLVFQLSTLGSLGSILHGSNAKLSWSQRYKIALGTANGLLYLHENGQRRIIHRDIKADNILLAEDFEPQICDFGLAKWLPKHWTHHNVSKFEGTFGYFAPEYFMHGIVDEKTDVYAFGVLLLELISGRKALDHLKRSLVLWARPLLDENDVNELVDPSLCNDFDAEEMNRVIMTASLCIEQSPVLRPQMNQALVLGTSTIHHMSPFTYVYLFTGIKKTNGGYMVVVLLRGDKFIPQYSENKRKALQRTYSEEIFDAQEYNSTKYLTDLKQHRELALGS